MKIYWSAKSIPELTHLPAKDKTELFKKIQKEGCKRFGNALFIMLMGVWLVGLVAMTFASAGIQFKSFVDALPQLSIMLVWAAMPVFIGHPVLKKGHEWLLEQHPQPKA